MATRNEELVTAQLLVCLLGFLRRLDDDDDYLAQQPYGIRPLYTQTEVHRYDRLCPILDIYKKNIDLQSTTCV